ncbi:MAG: alpha-1,2-fucosyltransferase [Nitrosomonadales bacterium]|nr:alpha-1,2-fucosyltransferase [Nitrosomonadales bacterium]
MKIITRIKGGLGNQLFCYAAARRLALVNNAELVIDDVSGFVRDHEYQRRYSLGHFNIPCRKASPKERMEPFSRYRRSLAKLIARGQPFFQRRYIEQEGDHFDARLLDLRLQGDIYLDGLWQNEGYFKDVEHIIRDDLRLIPPTDELNQGGSVKIKNSNNAVALHVRWFDAPGSTTINNISANYYQRAIALMNEKIDSPRYFLFSDNPEAARVKLGLAEGCVTLVDHNKGDESAHADLWLMTLCQHFITANSTFSWWGAWLGGGKEKIVICPDLEVREDKTSPWNLSGQLPSGWIKL